MLTETAPRQSSHLAGFRKSDRLTTLDLPDDACLPEIAKSIESAMKAEKIAGVRRASAGFLKAASRFCKVPECGVRYSPPDR